MLARELDRRGHCVLLAGDARFLREWTRQDPRLGYVELPDIPAGEGLRILRSLWKRPDLRWLHTHVRAELELLDRVRPDLVVVDFRLTMFISARRRGIPIVSLLGGRWLYPYAAKPYRAFRTAPAFWVRRLLGERLSEMVIPRGFRWLLRYKIRPYRRLLAHYGLEPKRDLWELFLGDMNLILDSELLAPTRPLPENFVRVGPVHWEPSLPEPEWLAEWTSRRPVIYVTLGSTGHPRLFRQVLGILGRTSYRVILTTGGQIRFAPEEVPENVRVETFLPGRRIMERADVVICHGGAGTVYQAIAAGTPCLIVATHFEQELLGQEIEEHGAGRLLALPEVIADPMRLRRTLDEMLEHREAYARNMQRLHHAHRHLDGVQAAAAAIEAFLNRLEGREPVGASALGAEGG
jgi:MGT family glycosyltransferase